jgi:putative sugar O-methyltransferase
MEDVKTLKSVGAEGPHPEIAEMFDCLSTGDAVYLPSKFWESYNARNLGQLTSDGYDNFKQTISRNYFTWVAGADDQLRFLAKKFRVRDFPGILGGLLEWRHSSGLTWRQQLKVGLMTRLLWKYALRLDREGVLGRTPEPLDGNPSRIHMGGRLISQDIANSALEYYSIREHFKPDPKERSTICELGAGYGRNAYLFAIALPTSRYVVIDIPPALYVAQRYLGSVFPDRKVFKFRCFDNFDGVREEISAADIVFLLPHQAKLLPAKSVDLFLNISSLHEMTLNQVQAYFAMIDRLTRGYFYSKQWFTSVNPFDDLMIRHDQYPVPEYWRRVYQRPAGVQRLFFEAMYALDPVRYEPIDAFLKLGGSDRAKSQAIERTAAVAS